MGVRSQIENKTMRVTKTCSRKENRELMKEKSSKMANKKMGMAN